MKCSRTLILIFIALVLSACSFSLAEDITPPAGSEVQPAPQVEPVAENGPSYPLVPPNPEVGQAIYSEKCAPCHGISGLGDGPQAGQLPNPASPLGSPEYARQATPTRWYSQVTKGNLEKFMPPFNSLSDRQRWDVVAYSLQLSVSTEEIEQGETLYQANCAGCHGESGKGDGPEAAGLATALPDLSDQSYMARKSSSDFFQAISQGVEPGMPAFADSLSEAQRWAIASYMRSLTFAVRDEQPITGEIEPTAESTAIAQGDISSSTAISATQEITTALDSGVISGIVTNASGGDVPDDLEITLYAFDSMQMVFTETVTIQPDQKYVFESVELLPERAFMVTTEYESNIYGSDIGVARGEEMHLDLPLVIYGTTTDASILRVDRLHLFFEFIDANSLRVIELYIMSNPTDKALIPEDEGQPTVRFTLPEGATNLEFQDGVLGERYIQTTDGFGDTSTVRPGTGSYEVLFAYEMPYNRKLDLIKPVNLQVDALVILIPEDGINVKGDALVDEGTRDVQGTPYHLYNGGSLQAGEQLNLTISGKPSSGNPSLILGSNTSLVIGLGGFGLALVMAGAWLYWRSRQTGVDDEEEYESIQDEPEEESADTVIDAIVALDDLYQRGELPEDAYLQRRSELKNRLRGKIQ